VATRSSEAARGDRNQQRDLQRDAAELGQHFFAERPRDFGFSSDELAHRLGGKSIALARRGAW